MDCTQVAYRKEFHWSIITYCLISLPNQRIGEDIVCGCSVIEDRQNQIQITNDSCSVIEGNF